MAAVAQFNDESDAFFGGHSHVIAYVSTISVLEAGKNFDLFLHRLIIRARLRLTM